MRQQKSQRAGRGHNLLIKDQTKINQIKTNPAEKILLSMMPVSYTHLDVYKRQVLIALGLPVSRGLNIPGVEGDGVLYALNFLKDVKRNSFHFEGSPTVIVVGGGNVAMDVARSAVRCGAAGVKVCLLYTSRCV